MYKQLVGHHARWDPICPPWSAPGLPERKEGWWERQPITPASVPLMPSDSWLWENQDNEQSLASSKTKS